MTHLMSDVRHAIRRLRSRPAFAATAILTLALGIAATTAIFSVVDAVLLKPLPWRDPERLISVYVARPHWRLSPVLAGSWNTGNLSWPIFRDLQTRANTLSDVGTWNRIRPTLNTDRNELTYGLQVSASFLPMLGVAPFMGRFFSSDEDETRNESALVSYEAWQRRYGGRADIVGQRISLDETPYTIVGVLPPGFDFVGRNPPEFVISWGNTPANNRHAGNHFMYGVARVRDGVQLDDVVRDIDPLVRGSEKAEEKQARIVPLAEDQLGATSRPMWFLLGAAGLLLLIACANVAGLLLGEAGSRRYEMAIRLAVGGSRAQIVRQMFVESALLAALASALAVVLVIWLTPLLAALTPEQLPRVANISVNLRVLAFALLGGGLTALLFGIGPALTFARVEPARWMQGGRRVAGLSRYQAHSLLVAGEVGLAVLLVVAASLLGESLLRMTSQELGFRPDNLVVASLRVPLATVLNTVAANNTLRVARSDALVATLAAVPGVEAATATSTAPFSGSYGSNSITIDGKTFAGEISSGRHIVTDDYFRTLGIPIIKGRGFTRSDQSGGYVAIVTDEFERRYLDGDAIGKRFTLNKNSHLIVGVVPTAKHRRYTDEAVPALYALNRQLPNWVTSTYVVRTARDAQSMIAELRRVIESAEPTASIVTIETMAAMMRRSVAQERYRATLSMAFGVAALVLAAIGLYGLISRMVAERQREIGVRFALGAQRGAVVRLVLSRAMLLVGTGLIVGAAAAVGASTWIATLLYGVTATSPHTFVITGAVLLAVTLAAAFIPARAASRTDPVVVLRAE